MTKETAGGFDIPTANLGECEKVAMFDIDGTLIDHNYNITDDRIFAAIERAKDTAWIVGLSSDTPYEGMRKWHDYFDMNGPIITEKGASVTYDAKHVTTNPNAFDFVALRKEIGEQFLETGHTVWHGDPVSFLRTGQSLGSPGDRVVLMNNFRRHSTSYYVRLVNEQGELTIDPVLTEDLASQVRPLYVEEGSFDEDLNHEYGIIIISDNNINKRTGSRVLQQISGIGKFAMIGNSSADYVGNDVALHLAVGDATAEYKAVSDYIAHEALTAGAAEALNMLVTKKERIL